MSPWVLTYAQARDAGPPVVGDQAWNLARLDQFGFLVPRGGVLVTDAYARFRERGELPPDVVEAVRRFLTEQSLDDVPLAIGEGSVLGSAAVLEAIAASYRSLEAPGAVVLFATVPDSVAKGVAFSADPRTGRRDRVVINVGGSINAHVTVENGLARSEIVEKHGPAVLTDGQYLALARLVSRVEWALGEGQDPQDVEWAFDGQRFWLLQARPIRNLPWLTIPLAAAQPTLWTSGNLKDAIAGVPTTATWSFAAAYLRSIFFAPIESIGYMVPRGMELVRRFDGRAYLDMSSLQAVYFDALGSMPAEAGRALGGPPAEITVPTVTAAHQARWRRARLRMLGALARHRTRYPRAIQTMHHASRALQQRDLASCSDLELVAIAEHIGDLQAAFGPTFQVGNLDSGVWLEPLEQTIERWLPGDGRRLAAALMAGSGQVVSAEHGYRVFELAAIAANEPAAREFLDQRDARCWQALPASSAFRQAVARFLDDFGHRGVYEAELANPRWSEDPGFVFDQVRAILKDPAPSDQHALAAQRRADAERALKRVPLPPRLLVRWLAHQARRSAALREAGKSALIAMAVPVRLLLLEFGRRLVRAGVLDDRDDVFHLARFDLEALVYGEWDGRGARGLVDERRTLRLARLESAAPPDLIIVGTTQEHVPREPGGALRGVAASSGRARGPARLILHPDQADRLQRGDILVAPSTDPGWTPLFLRAAAVVTAVGGYLSHGAIVAREFGLPAVVNVPRVFERIADGDIITVDGDAGLVLHDRLP